mmetsp:Transcript_24874/g.57544  ORF Transcript_24874/g.57544 Transcript_24874/m.57544 type:complete len:253 (-) Transcript_24874:6332-7090(-)
MGAETDFTPLLKPLLSTQSRIVPKTRWRDSPSNGTKLTTLKCRTYRCVMRVRPPPGGPIAAMNCVSTIWRYSFSSRLYQPAWSIHCRKISIGGCAPYSSLAGMFRSSTKTMQVLFSGGPRTPLRRLSSLPSMMSCVAFAVVCAEKLTLIDIHESSEPFRSLWFFTETLLPVPVSPVQSTWNPFVSSSVMSHSDRIVSTVGTTTLVNAASFGMPKRDDGSTQLNHWAFFMSKRKSCTSAPSGGGMMALRSWFT